MKGVSWTLANKGGIHIEREKEGGKPGSVFRLLNEKNPGGITPQEWAGRGRERAFVSALSLEKSGIGTGGGWDLQGI